jgi:hypothetical protein
VIVPRPDPGGGSRDQPSSAATICTRETPGSTQNEPSAASGCGYPPAMRLPSWRNTAARASGSEASTTAPCTALSGGSGGPQSTVDPWYGPDPSTSGYITAALSRAAPSARRVPITTTPDWRSAARRPYPSGAAPGEIGRPHSALTASAVAEAFPRSIWPSVIHSTSWHADPALGWLCSCVWTPCRAASQFVSPVGRLSRMAWRS